MTVEIIGRSCVAPGADSVEALRKLLQESVCAVSRIPSERWDQARFWHPSVGAQGKAYTFAAGVLDDAQGFDPAVFGLSRTEATFMDPQQRVLLQLVWRALEDGALSVDALQKERVGVYIGGSSLDNGNLYSEDPASGSPYFMTGNTLSIVANRISHIFGLRGPSMTIDTACSSSLVAVDQAVAALTRGDIDTAIVGGINLLMHPFSFIGFSQARMLSPEGLCRAYSEHGQGYVRAEGGGVIVLRRTRDALANGDRRYAQIVATGVNSAGRTNGISLPSREAQAALLRTIYEAHEIDPNSLAFVEGHGTGTKVGDPAEVWALGTVLGQARSAPLPIGSIKTNIGHAEPASGILGLIKAVLSLQHDFLPASLHAEHPNESIDFEGLNIRINTTGMNLLRGRAKRLAGVNSFGFGGTNAHVVIADPEPEARRERGGQEDGLFMVSAHTRTALETLLAEYRDRMAAVDGPEAEKIVRAAIGNRSALKHRFVVASADAATVGAAIAEHLAENGSGLGETGEALPRAAKVAFVFAGNGAQWPGMGLAAYRQNADFRRRFESFSALFEPHLGLSLVSLLTEGGIEAHLADTKIAQPLLFAVQAALSDCLVAGGLQPSAVYGHSVGEIAAAYAAGILSAEDAVAIVAIRSRHQDALAGEGTMAAVAMSEEAARDFTREHGFDDICVAAINAPNSVTVSGPREQIKQFREKAKKAQTAAFILDINYPFHHPVIDRAKQAFLDDLPGIAAGEGSLPFISTVMGEALSGPELNAQYWWRNVRDPVLFQAGTEAALAMGCRLFVEISPRPILGSYVTDVAKQVSVQAASIATFNKTDEEDGPDPVARSFARAVAHGAAPASLVPANSRDASVDLPLLPFELQDLRPQPTSDRVDIYGRENRQPYTLLGWRTDPNSHHWKNHVDAHLFPDLAEHVVDGKAILPGSGFIEIAVTAAQRSFATDEVEVTNLEIMRPLELRENGLTELSTSVSPETGLIEIRSREYLSEDEWTLHAVARARKPVRRREGFGADLGNVKAMASVGAGDAYATARQFGLDYGPAFRLLANATFYGKRFVEVELKAADAPVHPHLTYNLNPVSVDASFHGLIALLGDLTGEHGGAPYIPVRFGSVRTAAHGQAITRAVIEIERFSANSIKARFCMFDADGDIVAVFEDCRFRRTWLRKHASLETASFHYEAVASDWNEHVAAALPALFGAAAAEEPSKAGLLLDAAVYRAAHEIALAFAGPDGTLTLDAVNGPADVRRFVASCLFTLEDVQIAHAGDAGGWSVPRAFTLPPVGDILSRLYREHPDHIAEIVLVNNAWRQAQEWIAFLKAGETGEPPKAHFISEAVLDHEQNHSAASRERVATVLRAVEKALSSGTPGMRITEIGSLSVSASARLVALAERHGATVTIIEPREAQRKELEIAFEERAGVAVRDAAALLELGGSDLLVASSGDLGALLAGDADLRAGVQAQARRGARFIAAERAPSAYADFVFGLTEGWFDGSVSPEFPTGRIASASQWETLLAELGFENISVAESMLADGGLIALEAWSPAQSAETAAAPAVETPVLLLHAEKAPQGVLADMKLRRIEYGRTGETPDLAAALASLDGAPVQVLYVIGGEEGAKPSPLVQDHVLRLSAFAEAIAKAMDAGALDAHARVRLVIAAPGGAPLTRTAVDAVAAGVWTFARVLQNEYEFLDLWLLDARLDGEAGQKAAARLLADAPDNREWVLDEVTGDLAELRVVRGPVAVRDGITTDFDAAMIVQKTPGRVDSIVWEKRPVPQPAAGEVVIEVAATGLNFRDVMWAMGLLPEEALEDGFAGATIGMEFSGTVVTAGEGVDDLRPGDRVMGIASAAFATHVVVTRAGVTKIPDDLDLVAASTVPVVFLTAWYAMVELGRIRPGETILIHGAAGGVGLAALQIAKLMGATVIATAGTLEKRRFLTMLGADHVFDSRTLAFVDEVLDVTGGEGVDLVLNSLFAEAMERSIELVKPFGRFLELGKRDYYSDRKIGLRPFRRNISYFGIDADQLLVREAALTERIFGELTAMFAGGKLSPLPHRAFRYDETAAAFRLMQNAGHIGKIVVRPPLSGVDAVLAGPAGMRKAAGGVYLVVGGIGGFGLAAANWLAGRGASHIALSTRGGKVDAETAKAIELWEKRGVSASVHACDVTSEKQVAALLKTLRATGPLRGVVHAAMVLDDALIVNLNRERNRKVIEPKVAGADILDRLTRQDKLDLFLLFSSATTMVGNPGQANYVAANGYLEGLARARRHAGLPGLAIGFGAIADTGFLARNAEVGDLLAKRIGKTALNAREALNLVEQYMAVSSPSDPDAAAVMISELDWGAASALRLSRQPLFQTIALRASHNPAGGDGDQIDLALLVAGKSPAEAQTLLHSVLAAEIAAILRVSEDAISPDKVLKDIGLDSLMAMELGMGLQQKTGFDIPLTGLNDGATVADVVRRLYEKVNRAGAGGETGETPAAAEVIGQLAGQHTSSGDR